METTGLFMCWKPPKLILGNGDGMDLTEEAIAKQFATARFQKEISCIST